MIQGVDLSHYQGDVNWTKVAQGIKFAYIKATEGSMNIDPKFKENWGGAYDVGVPVGAYHFFDPSQDSGMQAEHFCDTLDTVTGKRLPPVLDIEKTGGVSQALILLKVCNWLNAVEKHTKQQPVIYTNPSIASQIRLAKRFSGYKLWIAQYGVKSPTLSGWDDWTLWQYSQTGKLSGVNGNVDLDYFNGTIAELHALLGG